MEGAWNAAVPRFLTKLWTLVNDPMTDDVIGWSENGQSFYIVDEQTFAKELLPKYFKHNNTSSFVRQLNMYGFRKVIALENEMTGQEKKVAMEFQHQFFRKGETNLLEQIKRKAPAMKIEDVRIYPDEFQRMMIEVQEMREKQNNMDSEFTKVKKEHTTLWLEMTNLRQKHCEQQQLLTQTLQFIMSSISGNYMIDVNRKRSLPVTIGASASKCARQYFHIPVEKKKEAMEILKNGYALIEDKNKSLIDNVLSTLNDESKDLVPAMDQACGTDGKDHEISIQDIPISGDSLAVDLDLLMPDFQELMAEESFGQETNDISPELLSPSQDNDPILGEDLSGAQCNSMMNRDDLHCIETNLVELKSLLSRKKVNYVPACVGESISSELPTLMADETETLLSMNVITEIDSLSVMKNEEEISLLETDGKKDEQVVQYMKTPLFSMFDEVPISNFGERFQDSNDLLLYDMKDPSNVLPDLRDHDYVALNISSQPEDVSNPIEILETQLSEETSGKYKLFPLPFLNPVANFTEESAKIEPST
ncbi:heat shock factor protein 3-like [Tamandua tetradactyla]|uniref:heat shock factor protein 3-like n=1 Tax=Tamandua tetradactyla TaxID=48850 RepID=UPI00405462AB